MTRKVYKINAEGIAAGRLASRIAGLLCGKNKVEFQSNIDGGDFVEVSNAEKLVLTGDKMNQKMYYHASQYPGGLKKEKAAMKMKTHPRFILQNAVSHMLPDNRLKTARMKRLKFI